MSGVVNGAKHPLCGQITRFDRGSNPIWGTNFFLVFFWTYFSRVAARWPTLAGLVPICPRGHFSRFDPKVPHFSNKDPRVECSHRVVWVLWPCGNTQTALVTS